MFAVDEEWTYEEAPAGSDALQLRGGGGYDQDPSGNAPVLVLHEDATPLEKLKYRVEYAWYKNPTPLVLAWNVSMFCASAAVIVLGGHNFAL